MASKVNWDDILLEWSYRLPKGYPTMKNGKFTDKKELTILREVMAEYGFDEPLNLEAKKQQEPPAELATITKEQLIANLSDPKVVISPKTLSRISLLISRTANFEEAIEAKVKEYLTAKDQNKSDDIVDILYQEGNDQKRVSDYLRERTVSAEDLTGSPKTLTKAFAATGLTAKSLGNLAVYKWNATPRLGDSEVLLAILLKGGSRPGASGDLAVDGQPCEVGGFNKRLTGQKGVNNPVMVQRAFVDKYTKFAESKNLLVDFVSLSGGAKAAPGTFHAITGDKNYAISQESGWFQTVGIMNKELMDLTKDTDDPVTKGELAELVASCLKVGFTQEAPRPWDWIEQYLNEDGTLQVKSFMLEFAVFYFDYYLSLEKETRTWFFLTNATQGSSSRDSFQILAFEARGEALRPYIFKSVGLTLPSYSSSAGPQGVAFALKLGKVAGVFAESADDESEEDFLY